MKPGVGNGGFGLIRTQSFGTSGESEQSKISKLGIGVI